MTPVLAPHPLPRGHRARRVLERSLRALESPSAPALVALFRVAFFTGLALHVFGSLVFLDENYGLGAVRFQQGNRWLYEHLYDVPPAALRAGACVTMAAIVAGMLGVFSRVAAAVTFAGVYVFSSFNALPVYTLALVNAFAVLAILSVCDGAAAHGSVAALWRARRRAAAATPAAVHAPATARSAGPRGAPIGNLIAFHVALVFFFAGVEKLLAGWAVHDELGFLLATPRGYLLRDWVHGVAWLHEPAATTTLAWLTIATELVAPVGFLFSRTRLWALVAYQAVFLGIIAAIEVPPLFYATFAFGALLVLSDADLDRLRERWRSLTGALAVRFAR